MRWNIKQLYEWIKNGCDNNIAIQITELYITECNLNKFPIEICKLINLQILNLSYNNLTTIPKEIGNLINLRELYLSNNEITIILKEICNLINLRELYLSNNKITIIPAEIGNLINLQNLLLTNNEITIIPIEIGNLINLKKLKLPCNKITTIPAEIGNLINLKSLFLYINKISTIPSEIGNLINLQILYFNFNNLKTIPAEIGNLINLQELYLANNNLTTLPIEITNIRNVNVYYGINPIEYIPPQVIRYLERKKTIQKIYNDTQSVHNHSIQEGIKKSINYIMSIKPIYKLDNLNDIIINNNFINNQTKTILFEYINCQYVHSTLNIKFSELLINVLSFIDKHEAKIEIYKVLEQEMNDTLCKCFTGRMSRLINCLNGFDNHIVINISNNEQIGNIIILIKDKLIAENKYTIELHKEIVMKELYDRGYDENVIDEWIEYI
jgi:Leucine-rich repeat (LRR) protein